MTVLAKMLRSVNQAKVAREIGRPRGFVHRLAHGRPLVARNEEIVPALAAAINVQPDLLLSVVRKDRAALARARRRAA